MLPFTFNLIVQSCLNCDVQSLGLRMRNAMAYLHAAITIRLDNSIHSYICMTPFSIIKHYLNIDYRKELITN